MQYIMNNVPILLIVSAHLFGKPYLTYLRCHRLFSRKIMGGVAAATCQPRNNNALWLTH